MPHGFSQTIERIYRAIFQQTAKSKPTEELEKYLQNSTPSALIKLDPTGLTSEDIKLLKELIRKTKTEKSM